MRHSLVGFGIIVTALTLGDSAHADCNGKSCTAAVPEPVPGVDELLVRPSLTSATASVSTKEQDTKFKATIVPSQFFDWPHSDKPPPDGSPADGHHLDEPPPMWFSELRFVIQTDISSSLTRLAVSTGYNPFSRSSGRVTEIIKALDKTKNCGGTLNDALSRADATQQESNDHATTTYAAELAKADNDYALASTAADQAHDAAAKVAALAALLRAHAIAGEHRTAALGAAESTWKAERDTASKVVTTCVHKLETTEWGIINSGWVPAVTVTAGYEIFPYGHQPDSVNMTAQDTLEWHGGPTAQLLVEARPRERLDLQAWLTAKHTRPAGDPGVKRATYFGGGATVSYLALSLLPSKIEKIPTSYLKDGFLPGIGIGASGQFLDCRDGAACAKGRTTQASVTPYIDFLLSSNLQFRLSLPITYYDAVDKTGAEVASTFSLAGTIGSP